MDLIPVNINYVNNTPTPNTYSVYSKTLHDNLITEHNNTKNDIHSNFETIQNKLSKISSDIIAINENITNNTNNTNGNNTDISFIVSTVSTLENSVDNILDMLDKINKKIDTVEYDAEENVQVNWNETRTSHDAFILNKPTIIDWTSENSGKIHKTNLPDLNIFNKQIIHTNNGNKANVTLLDIVNALEKSGIISVEQFEHT